MLSKRLNTYASREDGFTLVELLIVVLIIGVLAAIAIPVYLGIQNQSYKSVVKADVNNSVKRVQVALTEGAAISDVKANYANYGVKPSQPKIGEAVYMANSPSTGASAANDYQIVGSMDKTATPNAAPINYTYTYDSYTGKFGEADTASSTPQIVLGSGTGTLPDGYTGTQYSGQIDATVTGGTGTTQYAVTGGSLPSGYTLNQSTGAISGNTSAAGTYPLTVTVTNGSLTNNRAYVLRVYTKPVITSSTTLPAGVVGDQYSQTITATGNPAPTFAVTSGSLPAGLTLDPTSGVLAGTPTAVATSSFTVTASNAGGDSTPQSYTIVINQAPAITTTSLNGSVIGNAAYSQTVTATGNPAPTFTATGLPTGMSINSSTGEITGSATGSANTYNVTVTATNTARSASKNLNLVVGANILTNPGFEGSTNVTDPWTPNGTTGIAAHRSSENMTCPANNNAVIKGQGNDTGYLLWYSGNSGTYATVLQDVSTTVTTGKTYTGGAYVAGCSNASQSGTLYIVEFNGGTQVGLTSVPYSVGSGWNYVSGSYTATGPGTTIRLQFVPTSGQGNILLDNASLGTTN